MSEEYYKIPLEGVNRMNKFKVWREVYDGEHYKHLYKRNKLFGQNEYSMVNLIKRIIDFRTSLLLTNKPLIKGQSKDIQEWLEESLFDSEFYNKLKYFTVDGEITGNLVFMVSFPKRYNKAVIEFVANDYHFPIYKDSKGLELIENRLIFDSENEIKVIRDRYEEESNSYVFEELYYIKQDNFTSLNATKSFKFKHDYGFLVHNIKFNQKMGSLNPSSAVEDYLDLNAQINLLNTMIDNDLDKTNKTRAEIDEDFYEILQDAGIELAKKRGLSDQQISGMQLQGHSFIDIDNVQLIPKREGTQAFNYVSFQASTDKFIMERDKRMNLLAVISSTPTSVLKAEGNVAQSGTAMRLQMTETILKTTELAEKLKYELSKAFYQLQQIEIRFGKAPFKAVEKISVQFSINLPTDEQQQNMILQKKDRGIISLRTTLQELYPHWTEEQILEEITRLEEEQAQEDERLARGQAFPPQPPYPSEDEDEEEDSSEEEEVGEEDEE